MYGTYQVQDGRQFMCTTPITSAELTAYKRSPDTFFGIIKKVTGQLLEPLDCYDFFSGVCTDDHHARSCWNSWRAGRIWLGKKPRVRKSLRESTGCRREVGRN